MFTFSDHSPPRVMELKLILIQLLWHERYQKGNPIVNIEKVEDITSKKLWSGHVERSPRQEIYVKARSQELLSIAKSILRLL